MDIRKIFASLAASALLILPAAGQFSSMNAFADEEEEMYEEYMDEYNGMVEDFDNEVYAYYEDDIDEEMAKEEAAVKSTDSDDDSSAKEKKFNPVMSFIVSLIIGLIVALIAVGSMKSKLKTVHKRSGAAEYAKKETLKMKVSTDTFLYKKVEKTPKQTQQ